MSQPDLSTFCHELNNRFARVIAQAEALMDHVPPDGAAFRAADALIVLVEEAAALVRRALDPCR
ncbi:MAG: hypothetical protein JWR59_1685 [Brevundimonas sp.]|jgi:hypothetical protein|nr:hypothetical protein [Brevundimonas sp.]